MKLPRRDFLHLAAGAAALPAVSGIAWAQTYPARPVRIIVGYPPGDSPDTVARIMGRWLSERLGRPFVIENKPGAGTNIAVQTALDSPADGYTLLWITTANTSNVTFYESLRFNFLRDVAPVAGLVRLALPSSLPHIRSGALRALAVTTAARSDALPDVPTVGDTVAGYEASVWIGASAPRGTPPEIVATLNRELNAGLANPGIKAQLADLGMTTMPATTAEFGALLAAETEKWGKAIRTANIKPE